MSDILSKILIRPICSAEDHLFQQLMNKHHYLKALPKISETIRYVATLHKQWIALISFSAPALKCSARDQWIGWDFRYQYDRLKLLTNNSRFLILPTWRVPNLASRILSLCEKRIASDWQAVFGHRIVLLETFVDPKHFHGTIYKAANWIHVGNTKGFHRIRKGYNNTASSPKMIFVRPLMSGVRELLSQPLLPSVYQTGGTRIMLRAEHMQSLPRFFNDIPDPRRGQGRRHKLSTILAIAAGAILCGMRGYLDISDWANNLSQNARRRFGCRFRNGKYEVPSLSTIRDLLIRIVPEHLDGALQQWNQHYGEQDESLAIDGKTMCNAIDDEGYQTHIMSVVGHESKNCLTQKKSVHCR